MESKYELDYWNVSTREGLKLVGELDDGDWEFFGYVTLDGREWEWGYVLLSQLRELRDPVFHRLTVEIDLSAGDFVKDELPAEMRKTE